MSDGIVFWGGKGLARSAKECADRLGISLLAVVDNDRIPPPFPGIPLLCGEAVLDEWLYSRADRSMPGFSVCIGRSGDDRLRIFELLSGKGLIPRALIHPRAFVPDPDLVEPGAIVLANATVGVEVAIGSGAIVNAGANVNPGSIVARAAHIAPGANVAGEVRIGESAFVGIGATVLPRISIGPGAIVGAGAVVTKDVPAGSTVYGVPARQAPGSR